MSAPDANGWMPIETAPRDGTDIIVLRPMCKPNEYIPQVGVDWWGKRYNAGRGAWAKSNSSTQPTMWQHLPKPPPNANPGKRARAAS